MAQDPDGAPAAAAEEAALVGGCGRLGGGEIERTGAGTRGARGRGGMLK